MAMILADGFDFYNSGIDAAFVGAPWATVGRNVSPTTPYGVGQSMQVGAGSAFAQTIGLSNDTTIYFAMTLFTNGNFTGGGTSASGLAVSLMDGTTVQCSLYWGPDGNFSVLDASGAVIPGSTFAHGMAANSWCHWQAKVVIGSAGSVELRKNNNSVNDFTKTGINTQGTANSYANRYKFAAGNFVDWHIDDLFMNSATGAAPNNWPGQLRAVQLMASADTAQKTMLPSAAGSPTNYSMVDELRMDSDTSYVYSSNPGDVDLYDLNDLTLNPASIPLVVTKVAMRKSDTGARTACSQIKSGAFTQDQPTINLATTYGWQMSYFPVNPNTSSGWTQAAVNAVQLGVKVVA